MTEDRNVDRLTVLAERGDAESQFNLGLKYANGRGVKQDYSAAYHWYKLAADQGNSDAQVNVGVLLEDGLGVTQDHKLAMKYYKRASSQGDGCADFNIATLYLLGKGVTQSQKLALNWFKKGAENGDPDAQFELGKMYRFGLGTTSDQTEALRWFEKAAAQGVVEATNHIKSLIFENKKTPPLENHEPFSETIRFSDLSFDALKAIASNETSNEAIFELARRYENGINVEINFEKARELYFKAATRGLSSAQYFLGIAHQCEKCRFEYDLDEASRWLLSAAENGHSNAQFAVGEFYKLGEGFDWTKNPKEASRWYQLAAKQGHSDAAFQLGLYYQSEHNYIDAVHYFRQAADHGHDVANYQLGLAYQSGLGVIQDLEKANSFFKLSAEMGNSAASTKLQQVSKAQLTDGELERLAWDGDAMSQYLLALKKIEGEESDSFYFNAIELLHNAANQGLVDAQFRLGIYYEDEFDGFSRSLVESPEYWFEKAAHQGHPEGQYRLGLLESSSEKCKFWMRQAADKGSTNAIDWLKEYGDEDACESTDEEACESTDEEACESTDILELRTSAQSGNPESQYKLGLLYEHGDGDGDGDGLLIDHKLAAFWLRKAAEQGHIEAQFILGSMLDEYGLIAKSKNEAEHWIRVAASAGHHDASAMLEEHLLDGAWLDIGEDSIVNNDAKISVMNESRAKNQIEENSNFMPVNEEEHNDPIVDDNVFSGDLTLEEALQRLRLRLLDLTGRNRLLNFRHSIGKSLRFVHSSPEAVFSRLYPNPNAPSQISPVPEPPKADWITVSGRLTKPEPKQHAASLSFGTSYELPKITSKSLVGSNTGNKVQTLYYAEDLGRHCRKIDREAKLAIEETGANMLYLVFGFLEFPESPTSDKIYQAPLICLPVRIEKVENGPYATFSLVYTGEELADNLSLREKVNRDFGLTLPEFDEDSSLAKYFEEIEKTIEEQPQWHLRRMMSLTLLSFANMLLVRDLDPGNWLAGKNEENPLLHHPIVRRVFEGGVSTEDAVYGEEYAIDDHKHAHLPLIYDADSSQHSALIDVIEGKNLVIEGPPGTGKSQTITNLIASALMMGKKVLFVSEKLAALEVVKARLAHAGLENFILELHSNKTNKKRVIEEIEARKVFKPKAPEELDSLLESIETKRKELKAYAELLNGVHGNTQNLTVHKVLWRAEKFRFRIKDSVSVVQGIIVGSAPSVTTSRFHEMYDTLRYVGKNFDEIISYDNSHPFWGFFPEEIRPGQDLEIHEILKRFSANFETFARAMVDAEELLGSHHFNLSAENTKSLINVLATLAPANPEEIAFDLLPTFFSEQDPHGVSASHVVNDLLSRIKELEKVRSLVADRWMGSVSPTAEQLNEAQLFEDKTVRLNIGHLLCENLPKKLTAFTEAADRALSALGVIKAAAEKAEIPFDGTPDAVERFRLVLSLAESAPDDVLHMRYEELRHPRAYDVLKDAAEALAEIHAKRAFLDSKFYLDTQISEADLKTAISVFREGDGWYRVFQGRWRKAIKLHKQLQRNKVNEPAAVRQSQLEDLLALAQRYRHWRDDTELHSMAGTYFKGRETPFASLVRLSGWLDNALKRLQSAQIGLSYFDPLTVKLPQLALLRVLRVEVESSLIDLQEFNSVQKQEFPGATLLENVARGETWNNRVSSARQLSISVSRIYGALAKSLNLASVRCGELLPIVKASFRLPIAIAELDNHSSGQGLLGKYFQGTLTKMDSIEGALMYGKLIKGAKLPQAVQTVLISETSPKRYAYLTELIEAIGAGWNATDAFSREMGTFGQFELAKWTAVSSGSYSEYGQLLVEKTHAALGNLDRLQVWSQYIAQRKLAINDGLGEFVTLVEGSILPSKFLPDAFAYRFYGSIAESLFRSLPQISRFNGVRHSTIRTEFATIDKQIIRLRGQQIARHCVSQASPPAGYSAAKVSEKTEMALIDHLISLTLPRTPVRQILKRAGLAVQALKPCFMMGPQAVAQFLEPGHLEFDIVVMDEASQLKPEEAIGAIARGKQLVVVGDPKQLPPTAFFSRQNQSADGDGSQQTAAEDAESILDVCISHFQPVRTLRWHYRSRHESLIAFSNHFFYKGKLFVFPSPYPKGKALGLHYIPVPNGVYENQMNSVEAMRVVDAIVDHIISRPDDSLGVVTLNIKQRDLIAELWEERRKSIPQSDEFEQRWATEGMGLFFKNLENVQGDERDCILISTTFGKPPGVSKPRQNFGPISRQGGWRRLNVLFTRARKSIGLISSMQPEDIIADSSTPEGTKALRNYLEFARSGVLPQEVETGLEPDSDFEISVIELIESWGYSVTPQLGVAGFRIDIAVKHPLYPSAYLAAIECDGATYHSGVSVRDRDRIRQEILESLGWKGKIWRIWSTDWFRNPLVEAKKLYSFLESLKGESVPDGVLVCAADECEQPISDQSGDEGGLSQFDEQEAAIALLDEYDDELEIEIGDFVTYALEDTPTMDIMVQITRNRSDFENGLIASTTPLAQVLLGAAVGDSVVLRVPGQLAKHYIVKSIKRPAFELVNED